MHTYIHRHMFMYVYMYVNVYIYIYMYIHTYIYCMFTLAGLESTLETSDYLKECHTKGAVRDDARMSTSQ